MSQPIPTPEEQAAWSANAQEYLKLIDSELVAWREEATQRMIVAARDGAGWAGNADVEYPISRLTNLMLMRVVGEQVTDAFITSIDMNNPKGPPDSDTSGEG